MHDHQGNSRLTITQAWISAPSVVDLQSLSASISPRAPGGFIGESLPWLRALGPAFRHGSSIRSHPCWCYASSCPSVFTRGIPGVSQSGRSLQPVEADPPVIHLGRHPSRESASADFSVINRSSRSVSVEQVDTSCPCVQVTPASFLLAPGQARTLHASFEPDADKPFHGVLAVEILGRSAGNVPVFGANVTVELEATAARDKDRAYPGTR